MAPPSRSMRHPPAATTLRCERSAVIETGARDPAGPWPSAQSGVLLVANEAILTRLLPMPQAQAVTRRRLQRFKVTQRACRGPGAWRSTSTAISTPCRVSRRSGYARMSMRHSANLPQMPMVIKAQCARSKGPATLLHFPVSIAVDAKGKIYVSNARRDGRVVVSCRPVSAVMPRRSQRLAAQEHT